MDYEYPDTYDDDYYNGANYPTTPPTPPIAAGAVAGYVSNCEFEGRIYADGENFAPEDCTKCTCYRGTVSCERDLCGENSCAGVLCPEIECDNKYVPLGQCCPVCPGGLFTYYCTPN